MKKKKILYDDKLGNEWIDWVEEVNPAGNREQEMYPFIKKWLKKRIVQIVFLESQIIVGVFVDS